MPRQSWRGNFFTNDAHMAEKKKWESFVTPLLTTGWTHLNAPDTKFNKAGLFHVKLNADPSVKAQAAFLAFLEERLEAYIEGLKADLTPAKKKSLVVNPIVKDQVDEETGDETGIKVVSMKMYATGKDKQGNDTKREPRFFDAKGKRIPADKVPRLSGGSIIKVEYSISEYHTPKNEAGITLYLSNVQIVKAVEYAGGGSRFGDEGDGFQVEDAETFPDTAGATDEDDNAAEDGDF